MPNKYGGYDYDEHHVILTDHPESRSSKMRTGDRLGEDGGYTGGGLSGVGRLTVGGVIRVPPAGTPNIRQVWDEFRAAHGPGTPKPLRLNYFGEVFAWAEVEGLAEVREGQSFIAAKRFEVSFVMSDPYWYENQEQGPQKLTLSAFLSGTITQLGSTNILNGGSEEAEPTIDLTITHPGTVTVTHDKGAFKLVAHQTGDYSIKAKDRFVTKDTANYHYRWDGVFPQFRPGQTSVTLQTDHGTATNPVARWHNRD